MTNLGKIYIRHHVNLFYLSGQLEYWLVTIFNYCVFNVPYKYLKDTKLLNGE